ncbi:hypothetical protein NC651_034480 [Populus alba x Populus x berolinensis]|nr:hypothetical protein NC651_034480 [Populus alba x Populus x berolinensis]
MPDYGLDPVISSKSSSCLRSCTWKLSIKMGAHCLSVTSSRPTPTGSLLLSCSPMITRSAVNSSGLQDGYHHMAVCD